MLFHDPIDRGKSETSAFPDFFGGEKRFEDVAQGVTIHSAARIDYGQADKLPGGSFGTQAAVVGIDFVEGALDDELAAFWHGVARVYHQIHQHLLNHADVNVNGWQRWLQVEHEIDVLTGKPSEHRAEVFNKL